VLRQWIAANPGQTWTFKQDNDQSLGQPGAAPEQPATTNQGNWGIWINTSDRFARQPNTIIADNVLRRFPSREAAEQFLAQTREENPRMRTDVEVREIPSDYELPGTPVGRPVGPSSQQPEFQEPNAARGDLTPRGPGPWEIYRISDNSSVRDLTHTDRQMAGQEARMALGMRGEAPELYGVRTRQQIDFSQLGSNTTGSQRWQIFRMSDGRQVGEFNADNYAEAERHMERTLTNAGMDPDHYDVRQAREPQPAAPQAQQEWTGAWLVLDPEGRVLQRFTGIGNVQADANRHAMNWLRSNPRHMQAGVTVAPEMQ